VVDGKPRSVALSSIRTWSIIWRLTGFAIWIQIAEVVLIRVHQLSSNMGSGGVKNKLAILVDALPGLAVIKHGAPGCIAIPDARAVAGVFTVDRQSFVQQLNPVAIEQGRQQDSAVTMIGGDLVGSDCARCVNIHRHGGYVVIISVRSSALSVAIFTGHPIDMNREAP
jgi:hypothetical protein